MLWNEEAVRSSIRNRDGRRVWFLPKGDQLTSGARDFLSRERIEIRPAETAKPERYRLLGGGYMEEKPEHMTHLNGEVLVEKTHPRICFRGKMDTLEAELILCQQAKESLMTPVGEILALARLVLRCDVLEEPLKWGTLMGLTEEELRRRSHFPQDHYGQPHFMPSAGDGAVIARLNRARCAAREAELAAVAAFGAEREDILRAMNRISSALYVLMIREKAGK